MLKRFHLLMQLALVALLLSLASLASATTTWDVSTIAFDLTPAYAVGALVLIALASIQVFIWIRGMFGSRR